MFSKNCQQIKTEAVAYSMIKRIEIIVAAKLYLKNANFVTNCGIRISGGGVIALFTKAIIKHKTAVAMQKSEAKKKP